jgi:hypothetical protein
VYAHTDFTLANFAKPYKTWLDEWKEKFYGNKIFLPVYFILAALLWCQSGVSQTFRCHQNGPNRVLELTKNGKEAEKVELCNQKIAHKRRYKYEVHRSSDARVVFNQSAHGDDSRVLTTPSEKQPQLSKFSLLTLSNMSIFTRKTI